MKNTEIKYRVWDNVDYMSTPFMLADVQYGVIRFSSDCPVMQYTGLKDKNGKEIYEGDIAKESSNSFTSIGVVLFIHGCWMVAIDNGERYFNLHWHLSETEVIGNIYENPELLKQD